MQFLCTKITFIRPFLHFWFSFDRTPNPSLAGAYKVKLNDSQQEWNFINVYFLVKSIEALQAAVLAPARKLRQNAINVSINPSSIFHVFGTWIFGMAPTLPPPKLVSSMYIVDTYIVQILGSSFTIWSSKFASSSICN